MVKSINLIRDLTHHNGKNELHNGVQSLTQIYEQSQIAHDAG